MPSEGRGQRALTPLRAVYAALLLATVTAFAPAWATEPVARSASDRNASTPTTKQLAEQAEELRVLRRDLAEQKVRLERQGRRIDELQRTLVATINENAFRNPAVVPGAPGVQDVRTASAGPRANMPPGPVVGGETTGGAGADRRQPVGVAPATDERPPAVAPIFDQPGVLTPRGKFVLEPAYQFGYSSTDRVALIGYTIIPALVIGLIDVRKVRITTQIAQLTARYGITNRMEAEVRVPYVAGHTDTISREIFTGSATDRVFTTSGKGLGDVEATLRYQFNNGGADRPYYIGWLRFKSRTGRDPFDVITDCVQRCVQNTTGTGLPLEMPIGSGFYSLQPGLTWLYPSDPVVFFGNISYLHNFPRDNVSLTLVGGVRQPIGRIEAGDIYDISIGTGLALNDQASISFGYDQSYVGATEANGHTVAGSTPTVLGSLSIGGSYRFNDRRTLNVALSVGVTRDTPDVALTVRLPMTF